MNLVAALSKSAWVAGMKAVPCSHAKCRRWLTQRALESRHVGITFEERWYCSYRCATAAMEAQVMRLLRSPARRAEPSPRMPLGLLLVHRGLITEAQLRCATEEQRRNRGELGRILVELNVLTERQVTTMRASQWGCPVFSPTPESQHVGMFLPATLMRLCRMSPLHYSSGGRKLLIGFADAVEYGVLYAIEQITGCKTHPCFITPTEMQEQIASQMDGAAAQERSFEAMSSGMEIVRTLCHQGISINADRLTLARCRGYLWGRFTAEEQTLDILIGTCRHIATAMLPADGATALMQV